MSLVADYWVLVDVLPSEMFACTPPVSVYPAAEEGSTSYCILDQIDNLISQKVGGYIGLVDTLCGNR